MIWSFISPKGGVGVSVLSAAVASTLANNRSVTLIDMCGDQPDIFGCAADASDASGVFDWFRADDSVGTEALSALALDIRPGLRLIPAGDTAAGHAISPERIAQLRSGFVGSDVIVDLGVVGDAPLAPAAMLCASGDRTTLVLRACYLAMRRARNLGVVPDDVVEVVEGGRALRTIDIEAVLHQPVDVRLPVDPLIARAVDSGFVGSRLPRLLRRAVRDLVETPRPSVLTS